MTTQQPYKPGPFSRISAISFPGLVELRFRIHRDDGLTYTPEAEEALFIHLLTDGASPIFTGFSVAIPGTDNYPNPYYQETIPGTVARFEYVIIDAEADPPVGEYLLQLKRSYLTIAHGMETIQFLLMTDGDNTLPTIYPRVYTDGPTPTLLTEGLYETTLPYYIPLAAEITGTAASRTRTYTFTSSVPVHLTHTVRGVYQDGEFLYGVRPFGSYRMEEAMLERLPGGARLGPFLGSSLEAGSASVNHFDDFYLQVPSYPPPTAGFEPVLSGSDWVKGEAITDPDYEGEYIVEDFNICLAGISTTVYIGSSFGMSRTVTFEPNNQADTVTDLGILDGRLLQRSYAVTTSFSGPSQFTAGYNQGRPTGPFHLDGDQDCLDQWFDLELVAEPTE
ncbi:MAG: hypothetical protein HQL52_16175 [Magnetococcales bacterium]|nr:hypothetical protein [Magnetococcales bacterium]